MRNMESVFPIIVSITALAIVFVWLHQKLGPYILSHLLDDRIHFRLIGCIAAGHVKLANIADIRRASLVEIIDRFVTSRHNRLFGRWVIIEKKQGMWRTVLITPDHADRFIGEVKQRLAALHKQDDWVRFHLD